MARAVTWRSIFCSLWRRRPSAAEKVGRESGLNESLALALAPMQPLPQVVIQSVQSVGPDPTTAQQHRRHRQRHRALSPLSCGHRNNRFDRRSTPPSLTRFDFCSRRPEGCRSRRHGCSPLPPAAGGPQHGHRMSPQTLMVQTRLTPAQVLSFAASCCGAATCSMVCSACGKCGNR
jgi:hypothetical protein